MLLPLRQLDFPDLLVGPGSLEVPVADDAVNGDDRGDRQQLEVVEICEPRAGHPCDHRTSARAVWMRRPRSLYGGLHDASSTDLLDDERPGGAVARHARKPPSSGRDLLEHAQLPCRR
jgi:hypothetical protein